jgi:zinc protease
VSAGDRPDRAHAPAPGPPPAFAPPPLELTALGGVRAAVVHAPRLGFAVLQAGVGAGHHHTPAQMAGRAALLGDMLSEGTRTLDGTALVDALDGLGAELDVRVDDDEVIVEMVVLARHLERGAALFEDLVLEPRFDPGDFERARRQRIASIVARRADPGAVAADAWRAALYGAEHALGAPPAGTEESLARMDAETPARAWRDALHADNVRIAATGPLEPERVAGVLPRFAALAARPEGLATPFPAAPVPHAAARRVTVIDRPGSPQTQIRIGHVAVSASHPDFFSLAALNHPFGGSISSRLALNLRERRGWTYGVQSGFQGGARHGWFQIATAVESGVAAEAAAEIVRELAELVRDGVRADEIEFTRAALGRTLLRQYESAGAKTAYAANVGKYGWPPDYPTRRLAWIQGMDANALHALARRHLAPERVQILCVGERARLEPALHALEA